MRLIFVESNTTGTGMLALRTAGRMGFEPVLLTSEPKRYAGLAETAATVVRCDTNDAAEVLAAVRRWPTGVAGVTTTSEFYLTAVAETAEALGLPGNPPDAVRLGRDKAQARAALAAAGVGQPRFAAVRDEAAVPAALDRVGLPCVVKPVDESGSQHVRLCRTPAQVWEQVRLILAAPANVRGQPAKRTALVEEFLEGQEFSVELFSVDGVAHPVGITAKTTGGDPWFVETGHAYPAPDDPAVVGVAAQALAVLGVRQGPTHTEVRVRPGRAAIIEVNVRLAGGMIPEMIRLVDGVDLLEQQLRLAVGRAVDLKPTPGPDRAGGIRFVTAAREGTVTSVHGLDEASALPCVRRVSVSASPGRPVGPARDAYGRLGHVIATGPGQAAVQADLEKALELIRVEVSP
jgi:cysteine synthase A